MIIVAYVFLSTLLGLIVGYAMGRMRDQVVVEVIPNSTPMRAIGWNALMRLSAAARPHMPRNLVGMRRAFDVSDTRGTMYIEFAGDLTTADIMAGDPRGKVAAAVDRLVARLHLESVAAFCVMPLPGGLEFTGRFTCRDTGAHLRLLRGYDSRDNCYVTTVSVMVLRRS